MALFYFDRSDALRILVAGGAGFLGSHVVSRFLKDGHQVVVVDNLVTGNLQNLARHRQDPNLQYLRQDVREEFALDVDGIVNLACPASPIAYQSDPIGTWETSVIGGRNLLKMADALGIQILQTSTSEVYGDPLISPQSEVYWGNVNPIGIRSCYDEGKRAIETLFSDYRRIYDTDARIVRLFNSYGPGMALNDGRAVSNFCVQALRNQPISVYGDGKQVRSFCYVSDTVDAIMKMYYAPNRHIGPINIGNPHPTTLLHLANLIIDMCQSKSTIEFRPLPLDDPHTREPDISLARHELNWEPKIDLSVGLGKTIAYFREIITN